MHTTLSASKQWAQRNQTAAFLLKTVIGANVVALLAQLAIPQPWGVAISAGSLGVMVMGFALGRKAAIAALTLYVLEGAAGLPVFANARAGLPVLMGPSGGYLFGYIAMAGILGWATDKGALQSAVKSVAAALAGVAVLYAFGMAQLSLFVPANELIYKGFTTYLAFDIAKACLACFLVMPAYRFFQTL